ncbi:MAG: DUF2723 domain-containing protein [Bacteroidales bacterium]|nr:DUF2723 domain-containing protein [Bacteroidales bacterium]
MDWTFRKTNTLAGCLTGCAAFIVYFMTMEPTVSFWDCGEFISTAFKLEVGHPPGAPFFMLLGRIFTLFAGGDTSAVAATVNTLSALCSGVTIMFLFWTITHLARKMVQNADSTAGRCAVIGAGLLGSLAYTFSDTFWFSAVEAEVYGCSSLFTAIVFWAILRWEDEADTPHADRWLILIAYLMGISIGVHLLNLLAIPAIVLVYYFRKFQPSVKGAAAALAVSAAILATILYVIIPGVVSAAAAIELMFVQGMHLPLYSGVAVYAIILIGALCFGLIYTLRKGKVLANTILLAVTVILIGYSSYAVTVIRSNAQPPMDQNNPENLFSLQYYLNREQYGDRPLLSGPYFNAPPLDIKEGKRQYALEDGAYTVIGEKLSYEYDKRFTTLFPRMYSRDSRHVAQYKQWGNIKGRPVKVTQGGKQETVYCPTFGENLRFFFSYQLGHMYFRYFMWNFAGRQNDHQADGGPLNGNWISGIRPLDEARLGPQELPRLLENKGRNTYFLLPLLFGLIGLWYQYKRRQHDFWVVFTLFFLTGIAIVIYLNQTPLQPRERDYAYAGSFYAFTIWIGLGLIAVLRALPEKIADWKTTVLCSVVCLLLVPGLMASQNWDDHDRSGRYIVRDVGANYLNTCEKDAILFTNGDNDTFPLWYAQEVEGIRTDVRVVNLSYLAADWYIDQMQRQSYESAPLPLGMTHSQYKTGTRDAAYIIDRFAGDTVSRKDAMDFMLSDSKQSKTIPGVKDEVVHIPAKNVFIPVDRQKVIDKGIVQARDSAAILPRLEWALRGESSYGNERIFKNAIAMLGILANNDWERPVYFTITTGRSQFQNLTPFLRLDGLDYQVVPVRAPLREDTQLGSIDTDVLYDRLMSFKWGNVNDPRVYIEENTWNMLVHYRSIYARLAEALVNEGKNDKAVEVLDYCLEQIPAEIMPIDAYNLAVIEQYYRAGASEKANEYSLTAFLDAVEMYNYLDSFPKKYATAIDQKLRENSYTIYQLRDLAAQYGQTELEKTYQRFTQGQ